MWDFLTRIFRGISSSKLRGRARRKSSARARFRPVLEALDQGLLPTISFSGGALSGGVLSPGVLSASGGSGSDMVTIDRVILNNIPFIQVTVNAQTGRVPQMLVTSIEVDGGASADTVRLRADIRGIPIHVNGGDDVDTLIGPTTITGQSPPSMPAR